MNVLIKNEVTGLPEFVSLPEDPWAYVYALSLFGLVGSLALGSVFLLFV